MAHSVGQVGVPLLTGAVADATSLAAALVVPIACYLSIAFLGIYSTRSTV